MHLLIDGFSHNREKIMDIAPVYEFLDSYPSMIGMTKIAPPYVFRYVGVRPEDWGITGVVLIAESHISIHTFPQKGLINMDIFSCKTFDTEKAIKDVQSWFDLDDVGWHILERGLEYAKARQTG